MLFDLLISTDQLWFTKGNITFYMTSDNDSHSLSWISKVISFIDWYIYHDENHDDFLLSWWHLSINFDSWFFIYLRIFNEFRINRYWLEYKRIQTVTSFKHIDRFIFVFYVILQLCVAKYEVNRVKISWLIVT